MLVRTAGIAALAASLAGCINDPYYDPAVYGGYYDGYGGYYDGYRDYAPYYRDRYYGGPGYNYRRYPRDRWNDDWNYRRYPDKRPPVREPVRSAPPRAQPGYIPPGMAHRDHPTTVGNVPPVLYPNQNYRR